MRIGINAIFLVAGEGGGIERYLRGLLKGLASIDKKNEYIVFGNRDNAGTFGLADNFREIVSPVSARVRPAKILWEQFVLPSQLKKEKVDVVLSVGNIAPKISFCPSIVIIYDLISFLHPENFSLSERLALRYLLHRTAKSADRIITVSESSRNGIMKWLGVPEDKISVIYGGYDENLREDTINANRVKDRFGIKNRFIFCVASTRKYKNLDGLVKAYNILKKKYDIAHKLVLAGHKDRYYEELQKIIKVSNLENVVIFTGFLQDDELLSLYSLADIFVYPSFYEGFGLPILEAMASGTPVVVSNMTSIPEVVGDAGLLFDPHNIDEMAEKIYSAIKNKDLRKVLISKGFERVKEFTWERTAEKVLGVINSVVKTG
ncbi:MAG: glycosyltransferase family 4 protein [Nitrospirota bacterium]